MIAALAGAPEGVIGAVVVTGCLAAVFWLLKPTALAHRAIRDHR